MAALPACRGGRHLLVASTMNNAPETTIVTSSRVKCDGAGGIRSTGAFTPAALGHPRVWLEIDEKGYIDCGYCDQRFVLKGGPADLENAA
jgi:NADH dehydrogenase (ubiquinone) Fe-S protein 6